jgi:hypothetical protein
MEIFSEEFKAELSNQLEALTKVVEYKPKPMTDADIIKSMEDCMDCEEIAKKSKKKKNKKFQEGDIVYFGILRGEVLEQENDSSDVSLSVEFYNGESLHFTKDGRFYPEMPIVISHFPYELKMKKTKKS